MEQTNTKENLPGGVFLMKLLFRKPVTLPNTETILTVLNKHLGEIELFSRKENLAGFLAKEYESQFQDTAVPVQLMLFAPEKTTLNQFDEFVKSQMWDCMEQRDEILQECNYCICANDMLAAGLSAQKRADLDMNFLEALLELYPDCEAIYFQSSGKLLTVNQIKENLMPKEERFIHFGVNVRFFNIEGSNDMVVDTVGMSVLFLPDMQYHFHSLDPNWIVGHTYSLASYLFHNDNPIKNGDTIDGIQNGKFDPLIQWKCHYEESLIQPQREVIDVCTNEYAAGNRNYE